jgi:phosphoglycerate dehydrogenase-like enzyme
MSFKMVFLPPANERTRETARRVAEAVPGARVVVAESAGEAARQIVDADAAYGQIDPEILPGASKLRWLMSPAIAPPTGFYFPELAAHPVVVTNPRGIFNDRIPAHIMSFVLAFARGLHVYVRQQLRGEWKPLGSEAAGIVTHLPDATALIVGVGEIGTETARLCAAFGMRVIGVDARRGEPDGPARRAPSAGAARGRASAAHVVEMHPPDALDSLLPQADFVILTIPHTPETEGLFDARRFGLMKRTAYFVNIGRGKTTKLDALNDALRNGTIAGAGLDVFEIEPLPADHPLWTAPNTLLTPHVAGFGPGLDERRIGITVENAKRFAAGQELVNVVDKKRWF